MLNKKGDIPSIIFAIVTIFIIAIIIFFFNHVSNQFYTSFDDFFNQSTDFNESVARDVIQDIQKAENDAWDYAFLAIFLGFFLALLLTMFSTRISPVFYWIYGLVAGIGLLLSVILANMWQEVAANPEFVVTITRFPIMNAILGTYYPTIITGVIVLAMILLFGKNPAAQGVQQ